MTNNILRLKYVIEKTGLSRSTIYARVNKGTFPRYIKIGDRTIGWLESDVENWISQKVKESRESKNVQNTN